MGLKIDLSDAPALGRSYAPGQKISGRVIYDAEKDKEKMYKVQILFQGKVVTQVTVSNGQYRSETKEPIVLFRYPLLLFNEREMIAKHTHMEWPFEFTIPVGSTYERKHEGNNTFARPGFCPLPPTFRHETNSISYSGRCYVRYKLKVRVNGGKIFHSKKIVRDIQVTNVSPQPNPAPVLERRKFGSERWQSRSLREEKHSFKQKMQHVFSDSPELKTPSIAFDCFLHFPKALAFGQTTPMAVSLVKTSEGPTDPKDPGLVLVNLVLHLKGLTVLRVERSLWSGSIIDDGKSFAGSWNFKPAEQPRFELNGEPILLDAQASLPITRNFLFPQAPNFRTYTISHGHELKAEAIVRHVETGHEFKWKWRLPFTVFPPYMSPTGQVDANSGADAPQYSNQNGYPPAEELPPYQEVSEMPAERDAAELHGEREPAELFGEREAMGSNREGKRTAA